MNNSAANYPELIDVSNLIRFLRSFQFSQKLFTSRNGSGPDKRVRGIIFDMWGVLIDDHRKLMPEAEATLRELSKEYQLAVATNIGRRGMMEILEGFNIADLFSVMSCGDDVEYNKPSIDVYLRSQELMGLEPQECIVVEDTRSYLLALQAAGFRTVWRGEGKCEDADAIIKNLQELVKLTKEL